jgi:hypothetical protein
MNRRVEVETAGYPLAMNRRVEVETTGCLSAG